MDIRDDTLTRTSIGRLVPNSGLGLYNAGGVGSERGERLETQKVFDIQLNRIGEDRRH
jgi:hypothetical protein